VKGRAGEIAREALASAATSQYRTTSITEPSAQ
jgi:hypothetical protein